MNQKFKSAAVAAILSFTVFLQAQETNSSPEVDSLTTDSIKTLNLKASKPIDGNLVLETGDKGFLLKDMEEARNYDSLWLRELHQSAQLFSEMLLEVQNQGTEEVTMVDLPTDTLKARLALLDEKTPFNISYNASLESVIKSFFGPEKRSDATYVDGEPILLPTF